MGNKILRFICTALVFCMLLPLLAACDGQESPTSPNVTDPTEDVTKLPTEQDPTEDPTADPTEDSPTDPTEDFPTDPTEPGENYEKIVISKVFGTGGKVDSAMRDSFIELYNPTVKTANLNGTALY